MRDACESLEQGNRGAARLRGFVSQDLYVFYKMTIESWDGILHFIGVTNRFNLESFRAAPMTSSANETDHGLLRAVSSKVEIAKVARHAGQLLLQLYAA